MKTKLSKKFNEALKQADSIVPLDELQPNAFLYKIAKSMIQYHGFYSYVDVEENLKIFVKP